MTTITLPPDLEQVLTEEADKRGTTSELLALDSLRQLFAPPQTKGNKDKDETLFDFLSGYIGTVSGTTEALSKDCGKHFTDGLVEKKRRGRL